MTTKQSVCGWQYTLPHGGWALWRRNLRLSLAQCKALRTNWARWYPVRYKMKTNESYDLIRHNSRAIVVRLLAERYDTKSNVKLGEFRSQLQTSYVSSHIEELWYNETACLWMTLYIWSSALPYTSVSPTLLIVLVTSPHLIKKKKRNELYNMHLPNPSSRAKCDTRSILKQNTTALNLEFSFS